LLRPAWTSSQATEASPSLRGAKFVPLTPTELQQKLPQLEIQKLLGQGGMGAVYLGRQLSLDRPVAVKILPQEISDDPSFADRFAREARALARLNHPQIVAVYDFGQVEGLYYLLMEYVDGVNLRQALRAGQLTPTDALAIVPQICEALQFAHDEGIVHRDIKPENILLDKKGRVKIADFGLAKLLGPQAEETGLTGTQQVMGTWNYMAPEQLRGSRDVDHRADIYSLGVVFYELLTGALPVGRFPLPSRKLGTDARLDDVVLRALEHEPEQRYQRASEVRTDLAAVAAGLNISAPPIRALPDPQPFPTPTQAWTGSEIRQKTDSEVFGHGTSSAKDWGPPEGFVGNEPHLARAGAALQIVGWLMIVLSCLPMILLVAFDEVQPSRHVPSQGSGTAPEDAHSGGAFAPAVGPVGVVPLAIWAQPTYARADLGSAEMVPTYFSILLICHAIGSLIFGAFAVKGGGCLRDLSSRAWVVTGAISVLFPVSIIWPVGLCVGVWVLSLMIRPETQMAFAAAARRRDAEQRARAAAAAREESAAHALGALVRILLRQTWFLLTLETIGWVTYLVCLVLVLSFSSQQLTGTGLPALHFHVGQPSPWFVMETARGRQHWGFVLQSWSILVAALAILALFVARRCEWARTGRVHTLLWHYVIWGLGLAGVFAFGVLAHIFFFLANR